MPRRGFFMPIFASLKGFLRAGNSNIPSPVDPIRLLGKSALGDRIEPESFK